MPLSLEAPLPEEEEGEGEGEVKAEAESEAELAAPPEEMAPTVEEVADENDKETE